MPSHHPMSKKGFPSGIYCIFKIYDNEFQTYAKEIWEVAVLSIYVETEIN
jgi:hypothetical protein